MANKTIEQVFRENLYNFDNTRNKSAQWFIREVNQLSQDLGGPALPRQVLPAKQRSGRMNLSRGLIPGNFYMYVYDPKYKNDPKVLPYYDIFPLTVPYNSGKDWFIGLNFHYMPYPMRVKMLGLMMQYANTVSPILGRPVLDENTRLNYNWSIIKKTALLPLAKQCIKKYLYAHVRSQFKLIEPVHWVTMMMLPAEHFKRKDKYGVWLQSAANATKHVRKSRGIGGTP